MSVDAATLCTAFLGERRLAAGPLAEVARAVAASSDPSSAQVFADADARPIDLDLRGSAEEVVARLPAPPEAAPRGPGRPKLGVIAREVTLLPRHWEWLAAQPGGSSVALRKLVEAAQRDPRERARAAREAAWRFLTAMAGDRPGYEDAGRALFADDLAGFEACMVDWPSDIRAYALVLARPA
ncbi:DUF2239 family protein [Caulobacter mirabilis]|uniref:DUF2239 domain-containing protein n=1 Tax=Caulobacter mirabilis TaxID=69666 RepID=A0A2D2AW23_9CAUL|nr:DUF2239 family protein [Caulobacter mirabilis]ATQ42209.1 hypothetical protein CSW64_07155 [Caulobacter mirabilis]